MSFYCQTCGALVNDGSNFCPSCGAALNNTAYDANYNNTYDNSNNGGKGSGVLKTAAVVGGVALGATALSGLARNLTHRRRPPYMGPMRGPEPMPPGPGGMGGRGGMGGPGGMR